MGAFKLIILLSGAGMVGVSWLMVKAREHALLEKVKYTAEQAREKAATLDFWKNVFAVIGVFALLAFVLSSCFGGSGEHY
jgi:hypothetical protein